MCKCSYCYNPNAWRKPVDLETAKPWLDRMYQYYHYNYDNPIDLLEINMMVYKAYQVWFYYKTGRVM